MMMMMMMRIACKMAVEVFYNSHKRLNLHNFTKAVS